jgi:tRNA-modifying protein YgfZ
MAFVCPVESYGVFRVGGADAVAFLQSQLTNDVSALSVDDSHLSAWCDPKGRVQVLFRSLLEGDDVLLLAPTDLVLGLLPRLKMFVLRRKVTIAQDSDYALHALCGEETQSALTACGITAPAPDAVTRDGAIAVVGTLAGPLIVGPRDDVNALVSRLTVDGAQTSSESRWQHACITAGLPSVEPAVQGEYIPHMLNLDRLDGVSFDKGCYPGQEIVARTHYLGRIKRRTYVLQLQAGEQPEPGVQLMDESGTVAGKVLNSSAGAGTQSGVILAVLSSAIANAANTLQAPGIATLSLHPLPYSLDA